MLLSVGDGLIVSWYTNVPTTPPLLHPAPPNHFKGRFRISFRINTSKGVSQVFILNDLQKRLSPLESALTRNQGGGSKERPTPCPTCATRPPWLGSRCFAAFAPCYVVCLQTNTNCPSCKSFVLITIQIAGGGESVWQLRLTASVYCAEEAARCRIFSSTTRSKRICCRRACGTCWERIIFVSLSTAPWKSWTCRSLLRAIATRGIRPTIRRCC